MINQATRKTKQKIKSRKETNKGQKTTKWLRTDELTQTQIRDIETNETDLGSERVGK